jgi:hypothetical protein
MPEAEVAPCIDGPTSQEAGKSKEMDPFLDPPKR